MRLHDVGVTGRLWHLISNFLCGTLSQVRVGDSSSQPWVDTGIAQGRVLSPLLFNLLVDSLAAAIRSAVPGVRLMASDPFRLVCQLYADDLVILADSPANLQTALSALYAWGTCWRFTFGIGPNKSAVMVFGPTRGRSPCLVHLGGVPLPMVLQYRYLGIVLTLCLSWRAHIAYLCARGDRLFHQSSAWCHGEGLPVTFALSVFIAYVLSSASFGLEHIGRPAALLHQVVSPTLVSSTAWVAPHLRSWLSIGSLALAMHCASSMGALFLCSAASAQWSRTVPDHPCPPAFSGSFPMSRARGPIGALAPFVLSRSRTLAISASLQARLRLLSLGGSLAKSVPVWTMTYTSGSWPWPSSAQHNPIYSRSLPFAWSRLPVLANVSAG